MLAFYHYLCEIRFLDALSVPATSLTVVLCNMKFEKITLGELCIQVSKEIHSKFCFGRVMLMDLI